MNRIKRLRIFAGPNGSGKSTLYDYLVKVHAFNSYYHINPDVISRDLLISFNLENWPVDFSKDELIRFLDESPFQALVSYRLSKTLIIQGSTISLKQSGLSDISYLCAAVADFLRKKMFSINSSFSFESVFSHSTKVEEIEAAKSAGFKTYLYFVATSDPIINQQRVHNRVEHGGHDVPEDKIQERYYRTMGNLYAAFVAADRVFFFDNSVSSGNIHFDFFAEKNTGRLRINSKQTAPQWFNEYLLKKLDL
jgi:predicted ABC-type ATPase